MTLTRAVDQATILQGCRTELKDLLGRRLSECGWRDQVKLLCRNMIKEHDGNVNVDQIVQAITPQARALVPDAVKKELLMEITARLSSQEDDDL
uniref:Enhancer of yellow 2 transcription factor n=1 Tax=Tabanus bromius TaxID=304241 RepID=A0A0K8TPQ3_TABBR